MAAFDRADLAARVARQPCVRRRMNVPRAYAVAGFEACRAARLAVERGTDQSLMQEIGRKLALDRLAERKRVTSLQFLGTGKAAFNNIDLHCQGPPLIIRAFELKLRRQPFQGKTMMVDLPCTGITHCALHRQNAPLPRGVEWRFVIFDLDPAEAVHAPDVVDAIHQRSRTGFLASPVPLIELRDPLSRAGRSCRRLR